MLYVFPDIVKVPVVMDECRGKSLSLSDKSIESASLWLVRFLEDISVDVAKDSISTEKSPVSDPVEAVAVKPESAVLIRTDRALNRLSSCNALDALFSASSCDLVRQGQRL